MFQAKTRGWKRLALGLVLVPGMAAVSPEALAQSAKLVDQEMGAAVPALPDSARKVMLMAREAFDKGDYARAKALCEKAKTMPPNYMMGDDQPDMILGEIAKKAAADPKAAPRAAEAMAPVRKVLDPKLLVKNGRDALAAGKLEAAQDMAREAEAIRPSKNWGFFDDTPAGLMKDVQKAKAKKDQADSARMMADARALYEAKTAKEGDRLANLEKASNLCVMAEKMHGPYSLWDFGEKPGELLGQIESAKAKLKAAGVVATRAADSKPVPVGSPLPGKPAEMKMATLPATATPMVAEVPAMKSADDLARLDAEMHLNAARRYYRDGKLIESRMECSAAAKAGGTWKPGDETPTAFMDRLKAAAQAKVVKLCGDADDAMAKKDGATKADTCLAEAQELATAFTLDSGMILAKRTGLKSAQAHSGMQPLPSAMPTAMGSDLRLPGTAEPPLATAPGAAPTGADLLAKAKLQFSQGDNAGARRTTDEVLRGNYTAKADAESLLRTIEADDLAQKKLAAMRNTAAPGLPAGMAAPATLPMAMPTAPADIAPATGIAKMEAPADAGTELLKQARLELQKGETETARRMTVQVLSGPYAAKADAENLLRTIEAEELAQKRLASLRAYDSGIVSYNNRDYARAAAYFKQVDPTVLDEGKKKQLGDMIVATQAKAPQAAATAGRPAKSDVVQAGGIADQAPKPAGGDSLLRQQEQLQMLEFQRLRAESLKVEADATARFGKGETDAALKDLADFIGKVKQSVVDPDQQRVLIRPIEIRTERLRLVKHNVDVENGQKSASDGIKGEISRKALAESLKQEQLSKMMKEFYRFYDAHKIPEANAVALKMHEVDPNDPTVYAIMKIAKMADRVQRDKKQTEENEVFNADVFHDNADQGPYVGGKQPSKFDLEPGSVRTLRERQDRLGDGAISTLRVRSDIEKAIEAKLLKPINVDFKSVPLEKVVDYLKDYSKLNIVIDTRAFEEENLSPQMPVTEALTNISMRSALNIILGKARLAYKVRNDVLWITTEKHGHGEVIQKAFPVADLVVRIANSNPNLTNSLQQALDRNNALAKPNGAPSGPFAPKLGLNGGEAASKTVGMEKVDLSGGKLQNRASDDWNVNGASATEERELIRLITQSIRPESWESLGGQGRIEYHAPTLALVVNQTPDIIEEIASLLKSLRRLQDREVAIEVKMITLSESFYEKIGVDFSMDIRTKNSNIESNITTGINNNTPNTINTLRANGNVVGLQAPGVFTNNLDVPIASNSNSLAIPPFGGYLGQGSGGLALGLAFLNDIQVSLFLEAAQGDRRINVMQAPKLTMFNGQSATIQISDQQFFMTGISVTTANGQLTFVPNNNPYPIGVQMTIQPTISGDGAFVRMNINHQVNNLASTNVPLFPITTFITPVFEGGSQGQPIPFTQYVQQPTFTSFLIQTTVAVPDGGTVLLGGLKTLSEGRNEFGPPVLSKIPYLNRLFRNNAYGRDTQSLLLMVTPRIIINQEEQLRQTGTSNDSENPDDR